MKKTAYYLVMIKVVLMLIIIFYLSFLYIDLFNMKYIQLSDRIKFICIILCFFLALLSNHNPFDKYNMQLLQLGLLLTVIADFFLLIVDDYYPIGVAVFAIAQITYTIRFDAGNKANIIKNYIVVFLILFLVYAVANSFIKIDILVPISLCYGISLVTNVYKSIVIFRNRIYPNPNAIMVALGMALFLLCDINVALYNILKLINETKGIIYRISSVSMWLYYLPSQVLLALSGYNYKI